LTDTGETGIRECPVNTRAVKRTAKDGRAGLMRQG
jgi:hypothetical protein